MKKANKKLLDDWLAHKAAIQAGAIRRDPHEAARDRAARVARARLDYPFFTREYFPHYVGGSEGTTPWFHNELVGAAKADPQFKAIVEWYRGAAKSVITDILLPLWLLIQEPCDLRCMVLVGANETAAIRLLNDAKAELEFNENFTTDFKIGKRLGDWADKQFIASNGTMFVALGMGQSVRGLRAGANRPDYLVIDDVDDLELSRNPERLARLVKWVEGSVLGVFTAGRSRMFVVNNRIAKDQLMVRLRDRKPHWTHSFVPALKPDGTPNWPEVHPASYFAAKRLDVGEASWSTEYMLEAVEEGVRFQESWIEWRDVAPSEIQRIVVYIDPSWRNTKSSDHKAVKAWASLAGGRRHLLDCFVRKADNDDMVSWCYAFWEAHKGGAVVPEFYIEGIFMQDDHLAEFDRQAAERGFHLPIIPDYRSKPGKESRIESMIPIYRRGLVSYQESRRKSPDMARAVDHLAAWDVGTTTPDDSPDADESAWHILANVAAFSNAVNGGMIKTGGPRRSGRYTI